MPIDNITLRDVIDQDLPQFYDYQLDPEANRMAAFTVENPADIGAFRTHWDKIRGSDSMAVMTILFDDEVAGHIGSFYRFGDREVTYWLGREYWGKGIATEALRRYLEYETTRPLYARVAKDNVGSIRVLEKCGFEVVGEDVGYANARGADTEEFILELRN
jgi:RimJ/RimL family protein N-acetyltransferase